MLYIMDKVVMVVRLAPCHSHPPSYTVSCRLRKDGIGGEGRGEGG